MLKNIQNFIYNIPQYIKIDQKFYIEKANFLFKKVSECSTLINNLSFTGCSCLKNNKYKIISTVSCPLILGLAYLFFSGRNKNQKNEKILKSENLENHHSQKENANILNNVGQEESNQNESNEKDINKINSNLSDKKENLSFNQETTKNIIDNQDNQKNDEPSEFNSSNELNDLVDKCDGLKNSQLDMGGPEIKNEPNKDALNIELKNEIKVYQQKNYTPFQLEYKYLNNLHNLRILIQCCNNNYSLPPFDFFKTFTVNNIFDQCHDFKNTKLICIQSQMMQPNPYKKNITVNNLDSNIFKFNFSAKSIYNQILDSTTDQNTIHLFAATSLYDLSIIEEQKNKCDSDEIMKQYKNNQTPGALALKANPMLFEMIYSGLTKKNFNMLEKIDKKLCSKNGYLTPNNHEHEIINLFKKNQNKFQIPCFASYPCNLFNQNEKKPVYLVLGSAPNYKNLNIINDLSKELQYVSAYYNFYYQFTAIMDVRKNHPKNTIIYHPSAIGVVELDNSPEIVGQAFNDVAQIFQEKLLENNVKIQFEVYYNENSNESELEKECARAAGFNVDNTENS